MSATEEEPLDSAVRRAARHLLPWLLLLYTLAFIDRVNVGYAKQAFMRDNGLSEAAYAFGAGIFFAGYALFEVPGNLVMHRVGARSWMGCIMVSWGLVSASMMFVHGASAYYGLRFLLGVAEAGFFPGVILYFTYWFPAANRARIMGIFYLGAPLAQIFGGPLSGLLLEFGGRGGLRGWQWMFLIEGMLATVAGLGTFRMLTNRPAEAAWLTAAERAALQSRLDGEEIEKTRRPHGGRKALPYGRLAYFGVAYGLIQVSVYGVTFYLPTKVAALLGRETGLLVGTVSSIPWLCALAAAYLFPRLVGPRRRPRPMAAFAMLAAATGIAVSSSGIPVVALVGLCLGTAGFIAAQPIFWALPTGELSGANAVAGIAVINSLGAVGGLLAPNLKAAVESQWSSVAAGQFAIAAASLACAVLIFFWGDSQ